MMKTLRLAAVLSLATLAHAGTLSDTLSQMDAASARFKSATADCRNELYEKVIHAVSSVQKGPVYFERTSTGTQFGALITEDGATGAPKVLEFKNGLFRMFEPSLNQVTELNAGANKAKYESYLTLGFGGSGKDLDRAWNITDQGAETIDGVKTEKLDLTPKDAGVKGTFTHITIWVDAARAVSLKQIFYTPQGDYKTATYTNIKLNGAINKSTFAIKTNSKTTISRH